MRPVLLADVARKRDRAVLVVTHDARLLGFADQILNIEDGLLAEAEQAPRRLQRRA